MVVVVTGMHRSGTSAVTELLIAGGLDGGPVDAMMPATPANQRGYFERVDVADLNDALLSAAGGHWVAPPTDSAALVLLAEGRLGDEARAIVGLVSPRSAGVVLKDPRFCLTLPFWLEALPGQVEAVVVMYRDPREVAASLLARDGLSPELGTYLWGVYNQAVFEAAADLEVFPIAYGDLLDDPVSALQAFEDRVGAFSTEAALGASSLRLELRRSRVASAAVMDVSTEAMWSFLRSRGPGRSEGRPPPARDHRVELGVEAGAFVAHHLEADVQRARAELAGVSWQLMSVSGGRDALRADLEATRRMLNEVRAVRDKLVLERDGLRPERDAPVEATASPPGNDPGPRLVSTVKQRVGRTRVGKRLAPAYRRLIGS